MEKSLGILLNFWGVFQFTHTLPLPSSHKQRWTHVSRLFLPQSQLCIGQGRENYKKILKRMHCFMVAFVQTPPSPVRLLLKGGRGDLYTGYFMREPKKYRKLLILSWILKLWILSRRLLSRIVAISTTIIFLPPMFASLYFYSFPSSTTTRNTTYFCNLPLCISLIINMKKQRKYIKNVLSPHPDNSTC